MNSLIQSLDWTLGYTNPIKVCTNTGYPDPGQCLQMYDTHLGITFKKLLSNSIKKMAGATGARYEQLPSATRTLLNLA